MCGVPVYHYEHIEDFANVQEHATDNITLICPNHHQEKTSRRLGRETIRRADANPYNGQQAYTSDHRLFFEGDDALIRIGGSDFGATLIDQASFTAIELNRKARAAFRRDQDTLLLNLILNDAVLNPIVAIVDGELAISTGIVDATMIGPNLLIRPAFSQKSIAITFLENGVDLKSGIFYGWGRTIEVFEDRITINPMGGTLMDIGTWNASVGISA